MKTETNHPAKPEDRKLGDEWSDWKGGTDAGEIDENPTTFFVLAAVVILLFVALFPLGWYLIKPRIEQLIPFASNLIERFIVVSAFVFLILLLVEGISLLKFRKSLFPYRWREKLLLSLLPKTVWLGAKFGISRDRVGNSFIKVHNLLTKNFTDKLNADRLLVLLPRCLRKEARNQIISKIDGDAVKILTAGGGEEAREAIMKYQPTFILALACERDLMSGLKDIAEKIPVIAIPNKRPEGPCKNTHISVRELDEALKFITDIKNKNHN